MENKLCTSEVIELILEGNKLLKKQAEERQILLKQIIDACESPITKEQTQQELVSELESVEGEEDSEFYKITKLNYLNSLITEIDYVENQREALINELMQLDANLLSRDELIDILNEYIEIEEASKHRLVANYEEAQQEIEKSKELMKTYDVLSDNDPRYRALVALRSHPQGISVTQLSFMLGTTQFQAMKIIRELIDMDLVEHKNNLLKISTPVELDLDLIKAEVS